MSQLQGAIQYVANRMNAISGNDDITAIKDMVVTKGNVNKAIQAHKAHLEEEQTKAQAHKNNKNTIVTVKEICDLMNREIGD